MNSIYSHWLSDFLPGALPDETRATCDNCVMCADGSHIPFHQRTKCCTYIPTIPNFLAGKILHSQIPVFESYLIKADIRPQGIYPHNDFLVEYRSQSSEFGRRIEWQCPYFLEQEGGKCGIWQNRNSRCATWFCKHLRGEISRGFWTSIDHLLTTVEKSLANWCIHKLEAGSVEFRSVFPFAVQEISFGLRLKQEQYSMQSTSETVWGKWLNRARDFYFECDREVSQLQWDEIRDICGPQILSLEKKVLAAYRALHSDSFPDVLNISSYKHSEKGEDEILVWTGNPYDPVCINKNDFRMLHRMNGLKMSEVEQQIPKEMLRKLFDAGIISAG